MNFVHSFTQKLSTRGWVSRVCLSVLAWSVVLLVGAVRVEAGCHYGDGRSFHQAKQSDNPREHARNFSFLGQWVYERGEMKYVPWQAEGPCHGPGCRGEKPQPVSSVAPTTSSQRLPNIVLVVAPSELIAFQPGQSWLAFEDRQPLAGFAFEHEHPPRMTSSL